MERIEIRIRKKRRKRRTRKWKKQRSVRKRYSYDRGKEERHENGEEVWMGRERESKATEEMDWRAEP